MYTVYIPSKWQWESSTSPNGYDSNDAIGSWKLPVGLVGKSRKPSIFPLNKYIHIYIYIYIMVDFPMKIKYGHFLSSFP